MSVKSAGGGFAAANIRQYRNAAPITINTTIDNDLVGTIQFGTQSPSNSAQARILTVDTWDT